MVDTVLCEVLSMGFRRVGVRIVCAPVFTSRMF